MYLKIITSRENATFTLIEASRIEFGVGLRGGNGWAIIDGGEHIPLTGEAYILNAKGKTIDSYFTRSDTPKIDITRLDSGSAQPRHKRKQPERVISAR